MLKPGVSLALRVFIVVAILVNLSGWLHKVLILRLLAILAVWLLLLTVKLLRHHEVRL